MNKIVRKFISRINNWILPKHGIKRMGKKAVHIGGSLQLYFGIKGKRWDNSNLYNEYWISPFAEERPQNLSKVEEGCYW